MNVIASFRKVVYHSTDGIKKRRKIRNKHFLYTTSRINIFYRNFEAADTL